MEHQDKIVYMQITKRCRVCFVLSDKLNSLYSSTPNGTPRDNLIMCTKISSITIDDGGPNYICDLCLDELKIVISFFEKCSETDTKWKSIIYRDLNESRKAFEKIDERDMDCSSCSPVHFKKEIRDDVEIGQTKMLIDEGKHNACVSEPIVEYPTHKIFTPFNGKSMTSHIPLNKVDCIKPKPGRKPCNLLLNYNKDLNYECVQCLKSFSSKRYLKKHFQAHSGCKEHTCELCGKQFKYKDNLKAHRMSVHERDRPFSCDMCSKKFPKKDNLLVHRKRHLQQREHSCEVCGAAYYTAYELRTHAQTHAGHKPHGCHVCGKRFTAKNNLHIHQRTHTGEKPHGCNTCGKKFISSNILLIHKRIHTGEKPYICSVCGARFAANKLAVHMRTHTGEKPHVCTLCGKQFASGNALSIHMRHHTGEKPYSCRLCSRTYAHTQSLNKHLRRHHKLHTNPTQALQSLNSVDEGRGESTDFLQSSVCVNHIKTETKSIKC